MRNGSIPLALADGTQVRDTVCQANTTLSMVLVPLDKPADSSNETVAKEGWRLSTNYINVVSVLGGAVGGLPLFASPFGTRDADLDPLPRYRMAEFSSKRAELAIFGEHVRRTTSKVCLI